jgi:epsilon-lactone hydrolase
MSGADFFPENGYTRLYVMAARIQLNGPARYWIRSMLLLCRSAVSATLHRLIKGPLRPTWTWAFEIGTKVLRTNLSAAFVMPDANQARRYLDSVVLNSAELSEVSITVVSDGAVEGSWFVPNTFVLNNGEPQLTLLYLHGGGYSFYPKTYADLIASMTLAARSKTFALDYRLSPEHPFPSQLEDALAAYRWLLNSGVNAENLIIAGDSAGGNLTLALLLSVRDTGLPAPALAITLSPATDFVTPVELGGRASITANAEFDWIQKDMLVKWADWFCRADQRRDPLVSPIYADLNGLPPIYIQAGRAEILYDSIQAFADRAKTQGAEVVIESWDDMNHDFQMLGHLAPQSVQAFRRIGEVIEARMADDPAQANTGLERAPKDRERIKG